ncbi:hypothetical protein EJ08DRAFT_733550 [Tothia fuscella]|uniref:Uncharacterized protein n=1 Tax=Tothia fuscella TaxID=1048955 RepID=A0A9P4NTB9_9PEZI|nr:hypothetical protein EJ08DRAFT_733550 [Tothia fuscella]
MARNKPRLYLALYARPKYPNTYHYALMICPKNLTNSSQVLKYHVKNTLQAIDGAVSQPWRYEHTDISIITGESRLFVLVCIAKVIASTADIERVFSNIPIFQKDDVDEAKAANFNCVEWVRLAIEAAADSNAVSHLLPWDVIKERSIACVEEKMREGRLEVSWKGVNGVPRLNLITGVSDSIY